MFLGDLSQAASPYPNGVPVAGTGGGPWAVGYYADLGVWVANTGFGIAPLYGAAQFRQLVTIARPPPGNLSFTLLGHPEEVFSASLSPAGSGIGPYAVASSDPLVVAAYTPPIALLSHGGAGQQAVTQPGAGLVVYTGSGGRQVITYRYDSSTGLFVPASAQGFAAGGASLFDELIKIGAIVGGAVAIGATVAAQTGLLPSSVSVTAGPGAQAVGGSGFVDAAAASVPEAVAPAAAVEVAPAAAAPAAAAPAAAGATASTYAGYASTAIGLGSKVAQLVTGGTGPVVASGPGGPVTGPQPSNTIPPGYIPVPAGYPPPPGSLVAPDGTVYAPAGGASGATIGAQIAALPPWAILAGGALLIVALLK